MRPTLALAAAATAAVLTAGPAQAGIPVIQITDHTVTPNTGVTGTTADVHIECSATNTPNVHIESVITFPDNSTLTVSDSGPTNYDSGSDTPTQSGVDGVRDVEITFVGVGEGTIETTCTQDFSQQEALSARRAKAGLQSDTDTITFTVTAPDTTPTSPTTLPTTATTSGQVASTVATNQPLARTGSSDAWLATIGAGLVAAGLAVTARSRRLRA